MNKFSRRQQFFVGLTLFSMFFGAGNLIFPPFLGAQAGSALVPAIFGMAVSAVGLPVLGVVAVAQAGGLHPLAARVHPKFADLKAAIYDFAPSRAGEHARTFLGDWRGKLVCDDYAGYKAGFGNGITEIGCMAHARRKFYDLHEANKSELAAKALEYIGGLYEIERETKDLPPDMRREIRQTKAKPLADALHQWMLAHRQKVPDGSGTAKALDYSLKRWEALTRYLDDGAVPIDNNWVENQIRPWALGRSNWLFAGSLRSGQRAAAVMTLIQSAKLNRHDPYAYLKDVLTRLPTQKNNAIDELLPHNWKPAIPNKV